MRRLPALLGAALLVVSFSTLSGCKMLESHEAMDKERLLAAAGFQIKLADTPQKLAEIQDRTQRKLVAHDKDGKTVFVYSDAKFCKCIYVGDQAAYQRYEKLVQQQNMVAEEAMTAAAYQDANMNWDMWGAFRPWW